MFWFYLFLLFVVLGGLSFLAQYRIEKREEARGVEEKNKSFGWGAFGVILGFFACVWFAVPVIYTMYEVSNQKYDIQSLRMYDANAAIYKQKADNLTQQFAHYLAEVYPEHERDVFKSISPDKVSLYLAKYPDLRASATVTTLVDQIEKLNDDYYSQQLQREVTLREIRYRQQNPWIFSSFVPEYKEK